MKNAMLDPYYGSDYPMKMFLADLDRKFKDEWTHVDATEDIIKLHNKTFGTMCAKLKDLSKRGHCELRFRGKVLKYFKLNFNKL